jgi:shikimate 5-dehydrogenase
MMLENKIAVIYGGGGAIGGAVARAFASAGARVYLAGRTADRLEAVANDIGGAAWKTVPSWFVFPELDSIVPSLFTGSWPSAPRPERPSKLPKRPTPSRSHAPTPWPT